MKTLRLAPGSLDSMGPLLTKLVAAVKATNLVDTLDSQQAITVFAPADPAFTALGDAKFKELAANPNQLAPIRQYHVAAKGLAQAGCRHLAEQRGRPAEDRGFRRHHDGQRREDPLRQHPDRERHRLRHRQGAHPRNQQELKPPGPARLPSAGPGFPLS
ncbi:Fasciclin domain-containing protein [Amycolatopsis rubida]|uniref:Fasciclin domain-containing protein n=1 Tax=Amycolatopsis rubida TaxID=112413 RepID=A0A1I5YXS6_9PSEU|nr:Fasciclin domain-containing protein [Amycolatopsis rubida]